MTFYNIIFGILFLAAVSVVVFAVSLHGFSSSLLLWQACVLSIVVFIDVVYTSHAMEYLGSQYRVWLKLIDLGNFLVLGSALLLLNPSDSNIYDIDIRWVVDAWPGKQGSQIGFWILLLIYSFLLYVWNKVSNVHLPREEFLQRAEGGSLSRSCIGHLFGVFTWARGLFGLPLIFLGATGATSVAVLCSNTSVPKYTALLVLLFLIFDLFLSAYVFDVYKRER